MDLSGIYQIKIAWQKPQKIRVTKVGKSHIFAFVDQLERQVYVEGREVGFNVTEFLSRDLFALTNFIVLGQWEKVTYRDWQGRILEVDIAEYSLGD